MNLQIFKEKLDKNNLIEKSVSIDIKGGLRYETRSYLLFTNQKMLLTVTGQRYKTGYHNGKYCIEW